MPVISVIDRNDPKLSQEDVMKAIHEATGVFFSGFKKNEKGWAAHLEDDDDKAKVLKPETRAELASQNIEIVKPPDYRASCSILIADDIHWRSLLGPDQLKRKIESATNTKITHFSVFYDGKIKMEVNTPEEAQRIMTEDIDIGDAVISAYSMQPQYYFKVPQCSKCFSFEHERGDCTSREQYCFICSAAGHTNTECTDRDNPRCKNCEGDHVAIAFKCPFRKVKEYELNGGRRSIPAHYITAVNNAKRRMGLIADSSDEEDAEETTAAASRSETEGAVAIQAESEGAAVVAQPEHEGTEGGDTEEGITAEESTIAETADPQSHREAFIQSQSDQFVNTFEANPTLQGFGEALLHFMLEIRGHLETTNASLESAQQRPTPPHPSWRPVRIVRAPNPEQGEGPRRQCRRIPNFKVEEEVEITTMNEVSFPILPHRSLRRCADVDIGNDGEEEEVASLVMM